MKFKLNLVLIGLALAALSGCASMEKAQDAYSKDYGGYLVAKDECKGKNFHSVKYQDSGGKPTEIKIAADCGDIDKPTHNGGAVAQQNSALLQSGASVVVAGIDAASNRSISNDQNDTRVRIAELQNEREANENAVLLEALKGNDSQTEALVEQNVALTDLIELLTAEDEEDELTDEEEVPVDGI